MMHTTIFKGFDGTIAHSVSYLLIPLRSNNPKAKRFRIWDYFFIVL